MPADASSPWARIVRASTDLFLLLWGETPKTLDATLGATGSNNKQATLRMQVDEPEIHRITGYGARLADDDLDILRVLVEATEPLQNRAISRSLGFDDDCASLRLRLGPRAPLRAGGYIQHEANEGYFVTEKGRNAVASSSES